MATPTQEEVDQAYIANRVPQQPTAPAAPPAVDPNDPLGFGELPPAAPPAQPPQQQAPSPSTEGQSPSVYDTIRTNDAAAAERGIGPYTLNTQLGAQMAAENQPTLEQQLDAEQERLRKLHEDGKINDFSYNRAATEINARFADKIRAREKAREDWLKQQPALIPKEKLDDWVADIDKMPDGPEKQQQYALHSQAVAQRAQTVQDVSAGAQRGLTYTQQLQSQDPEQVGRAAYGAPLGIAPVVRGAIQGGEDLATTALAPVLTDKQRSELDAQKALNATYGRESGKVGELAQTTAGTLANMALMHGLGIPIIPGFAAQIVDQTYREDRKAGISDIGSAAHATFTAGLQSALMVMAGKIGQEFGLLPREELLNDLSRKAASLMSKEGLSEAAKDVAFQAGEGGAIHIAQSALDWATGVRPDALDADKLWPEAGKAALDWGVLGVAGRAGKAGLHSIDAARDAYKRVVQQWPDIVRETVAKDQQQPQRPTPPPFDVNTAEQWAAANPDAAAAMASHAAAGKPITRGYLEKVGVPFAGGSNEAMRKEFGQRVANAVESQKQPTEVGTAPPTAEQPQPLPQDQTQQPTPLTQEEVIQNVERPQQAEGSAQEAQGEQQQKQEDEPKLGQGQSLLTPEAETTAQQPAETPVPTETSAAAPVKDISEGRLPHEMRQVADDLESRYTTNPRGVSVTTYGNGTVAVGSDLGADKQLNLDLTPDERKGFKRLEMERRLADSPQERSDIHHRQIEFLRPAAERAIAKVRQDFALPSTPPKKINPQKPAPAEPAPPPATPSAPAPKRTPAELKAHILAKMRGETTTGQDIAPPAAPEAEQQPPAKKINPKKAANDLTSMPVDDLYALARNTKDVEVRRAAIAEARRKEEIQRAEKAAASKPKQQPVASSEMQEFGREVLDTARSLPPSFGENKIFVHKVWEKYHETHADVSLDDFKTKLVTANREGTVGLSRADLVTAMDRNDVVAAEINQNHGLPGVLGVGAETKHFIRTDSGSAKAPNRKLKPSPPSINDIGTDDLESLIKGELDKKYGAEPSPPPAPTKKINPQKKTIAESERSTEPVTPSSPIEAAHAEARKFAELFKSKQSPKVDLSEDAKRQPRTSPLADDERKGIDDDQEHDPELSAAAAKMTAMYVKAGVKDYADFISQVSSVFGDESAAKAERYLRDSWDVLRGKFPDAGLSESHAIGEGGSSTSEPTAPQAAVPEQQVESVTPQEGAPPEQTQPSEAATVKDAPIADVPVSEIELDPSRFQFKAGVNRRGVVESDQLSGDYNPFAAGSVLLWEAKNGRKFVVNGHHRFDLAQRTGRDTIRAQVVRESDGVTADQAKALGAELNILEGQGTVDDYASFFRQTEISENAAQRRGLLARSKGQTGFLVGKFASDDTWTAFRSGKISAEKAAIVADEGRGDPGFQQVGLEKARSLNADELRSSLRALKLFPRSEATTQQDLFGGFDDTAIRESEQMGKAAGDIIGNLKDRILAVRGALKRPETAREMGLVGDMPSIQSVVDRLTNKLDDWSRWTTDPDLVRQVREKAGLPTDEKFALDRGESPDKTPIVEEYKANDEQRLPPSAKSERQPNLEGMPTDMEKGTLEGQKGLFEASNQPAEVLGFGSSRSKPSEQTDLQQVTQTPPEIHKGLYGGRGFIAQDVVPRATFAGKALAEAVDTFKKFFAPQTRGPKAKATALATREMAGELARKLAVAQDQLRQSSKFFDLRPAEENLAFIDRMEKGERQPTIQETKAANVMRRQLDEARGAVQNLGTGKLEHWIENYFPHVWKDPTKARDVLAQILGKRPLEGSKSFLKKRTIPTIADGIAAGLDPISTNPVDLTLLKLREMYKYIGSHKLLENELKPNNLAVFVPVMERAPEGHTQYDDRMFTVYGPPTVKMSEFVDENVYNKLSAVADRLGITHTRTASAGRGRLGFSEQGANRVTTQSATELSVMAHEIGHQLDHKYGLREMFGLDGRKLGGTLRDEFRAIADLRFEGKRPEEISQHARSYTRRSVEKIAQMVEAFVHAPDRMQEVAPRIYDKFKSFIEGHSELSELADIKQSLALKELEFEKAHGGLLILGHYYGPEQATRVLNNYLSPGLRERSGVFRGLLSIGNSMNMAQLGVSAFHAGFTSMDAAVSRFSLGVEQAAHGEGEAAKTIASTAIAPVTNVRHGLKLRQEYLRPGSVGGQITKIVDALVAGGGRVEQDDFYKTQMTKQIKEAIRTGNFTGAALRAPMAAIEQASRPIMEVLVPLQKLGIFHDMMKAELDRRPDMTHDELREAAAKAWDSVDNRLGQMVYDNTFMHKAMKDLLFATVRSVGWNLGTFRELGGGASDVVRQGFKLARFEKPELTHRMAYIVALPIVAGLAGATFQYMATGKPPDELKDYFFPKTGGKDEEGHDERVSLPSYIKDIYAYWHDPGKTISHKLHPLIGTVADMLQNVDFYGTQIRNQDDPLVKQVLDEALYAAKQFTPFAIRGAAKLRDEGASLKEQALPFVGIVPAPSSIVKTAAEQKASELVSERMPRGSRTAAEAERVTTKRGLAKKIKADGAGAASPEVQKAIAEGKISESDVKDIVRSSGKSQLEASVQHLTADDAMKVYRVADAGERTRLYPMIYGKIERAENLSDDDRAKLREELGPLPDGINLPAIKDPGDLTGRLAYQATEPSPRRKLGEKKDDFDRRVKEHAASTENAQKALAAMGASDPAKLRRSLVAEQRRRGLKTTTMDDNGNPTAFGARMQRVRSRVSSTEQP
jgi:hypothetical protein